MHIVRILHRWAGLAAFVWLIVLGVTGFVLDHPEWRWAKQWTLPDTFASDHVLNDQVKGTIVRRFQMNPTNPRELIGGGERGLWRTSDAGKTWRGVGFEGASGIPRTLMLVADPEHPWQRMWLATDDGVWTVSGADGPARPFALHGKHVTSLDHGSRPDELIGAIDHGRIFRLSLDDPENVTWIDVSEARVSGLPDEVGLVRLLVDLHIGAGVTGGGSSIWISDFGALATVVLSITGLIYWLITTRGRRRDALRQKLPATTKKGVLQWTYRLHGPLIGLLAIVPIVYLSVSGIFLDHARALIGKVRHVVLPRAALPPAYDLHSLEGEIDKVQAFRDEPQRLLAFTRLGLVESQDGGANWAHDPDAPLPIHLSLTMAHMHRKEGVTFLGTHGGPNYVRADGSEAWVKVPKLRMLVTDATRVGDEWYFKGSRGFVKGTLDGRFERVEIPNPPLDGLPVFRFMADLHTGMMIHPQFVWVNDLAALVAVALCVTGVIAWWDKKWI
jgi:hypothetical protein